MPTSLVAAPALLEALPDVVVVVDRLGCIVYANPALRSLLGHDPSAVRGRPLSERTVEYGFRVGLGLVVTLFLFVTYQDLSRFQKVVDFFRALVS